MVIAELLKSFKSGQRACFILTAIVHLNVTYLQKVENEYYEQEYLEEGEVLCLLIADALKEWPEVQAEKQFLCS